MRNNYLFFYNARYISHLADYSPVKIKGKIKIPVTKGGDIDRRSKIYKKLMKDKPLYYIGVKADVKI